MRVANLAPDFGPLNEKQLSNPFFNNIIGFERFSEARLSGAGMKFVQRTEKRLSGNDIHADALFVVVPVFIFERRLGAVLSGYLILERRQGLAEFFIARPGITRHVRSRLLPGAVRKSRSQAQQNGGNDQHLQDQISSPSSCSIIPERQAPPPRLSVHRHLII